MPRHSLRPLRNATDKYATVTGGKGKIVLSNTYDHMHFSVKSSY